MQLGQACGGAGIRRREQCRIVAAMGKTRRGFSGEDVLFWGDANYQFQANLNDKDIVVGHASALPPKVTDAIRDQFDCAHG